MKRARKALAWAIAGALLAPGALLADDAQPAPDQPPAVAPAPTSGGTGALAATEPLHAALDASPDHPVADTPVHLDAGRSSGPIVRYAWDLDGDGTFETDGGDSATLDHSFPAGTVRVAVRVLDAQGNSADKTRELTVDAPAPPPAPAPAQPDPQPAPAQPAPAPVTVTHQAAAPERPRRHAKTVHAAGASSVTIQNFAYSPSTIDVKVGDTITWTNRDSAPHTATASDGSFNTGIINQGKSGSHTFTKAGTFPYICAVHPNMKATVVVAGSGGSSGGGGGGSAAGSTGGSGGSAGSSGSSGSSSPGAAAAGSAGSGGGSLPHTGLELLAIVAVGAAMTAAGAGLRRIVEH